MYPNPNYWKYHVLIQKAIQAAVDVAFEGQNLMVFEMPFSNGIQVRVVKRGFVAAVATTREMGSLAESVNSLWAVLADKIEEALPVEA